MGRGPRRGGRKKFTDFKTLEKEAKELQERKERGYDSDSEESSDKSSSSSSSSSDSEEAEERRRGDAAMGASMKAMGLAPTGNLTRREREALEAQRAKERYFKLQKQGKTEQARKDLERLALVRKQREEAAKKRAEEKAAKEASRKK